MNVLFSKLIKFVLGFLNDMYSKRNINTIIDRKYFYVILLASRSYCLKRNVFNISKG